MDESVGWAREQVFGPAGEIQDVAQSGPERSAMKRKAGWRKGEVKWEDGGVAGGLMGLVVGTACEYIYPSIFLAHYQYLTKKMIGGSAYRQATETAVHPITYHGYRPRQSYERYADHAGAYWPHERRRGT